MSSNGSDKDVTQVPADLEAPGKQKRRMHTAIPARKFVLNRSGYSYEQLDTPEFLSTEWVPPDVARVRNTRRNGPARPCQVELSVAGEAFTGAGYLRR